MAHIVLIFCHILVLQEYWVLTESRILLKPVLGGVRIVALFISSHEQTQYNRVGLARLTEISVNRLIYKRKMIIDMRIQKSVTFNGYSVNLLN